MGTEARWKSTLARKRFIWPVVTRLRRSRATSSTFLKRRLDALAGGGGDEDEWGVVEELEVVADLLLVDFGVGGLAVASDRSGSLRGAAG